MESRTNKTNEKQNRNRVKDIGNKLVGARGEGVGVMRKNSEGEYEVRTSGYKINKSQGCNVQPGEHSQ